MTGIGIRLGRGWYWLGLCIGAFAVLWVLMPNEAEEWRRP